MNIQELNYHNYILPFTSQYNGQDLVSDTWNNIVSNTPLSIEELDYHAYYASLSPIDRADSAYSIYSNLYDILAPNEAQHDTYEIAFNNHGNSLAICKRKKAPMPH